MNQQFSVGDVLRCINERTRGYRVWQVTAILLGAVGQENVICLKTLDLLPSYCGGDGDLSIPEDMLRIAIQNGMEWQQASK